MKVGARVYIIENNIKVYGYISKIWTDEKSGKTKFLVKFYYRFHAPTAEFKETDFNEKNILCLGG